SKLTRPSGEITLLDVYRAVEGGRLLSLHRQRPDPHCPVGMNIEGVLGGILGQAEAAFEQALAGVTVEKVVRAVRTCGARPRVGDGRTRVGRQAKR
ncbi:MAG TPA: Rrf2 family transcriptional regulator, partial [Pyrinomonadaceae bacterium]|nr:Rrf2 family transcriptional regulator [Pyrinomonadaceae bacterium]